MSQSNTIEKGKGRMSTSTEQGEKTFIVLRQRRQFGGWEQVSDVLPKTGNPEEAIKEAIRRSGGLVQEGDYVAVEWRPVARRTAEITLRYPEITLMNPE